MPNTRSNNLPKRHISIQEACILANKHRHKKKAQVVQRYKAGWKNVDPDKGSWAVKAIDTPTAGARLVNIKQTSTILDVFFCVLPPAVLVAVWKDIGSKKMVFNGKPMPLSDIYKMYAANLNLWAAAYHIDKGTCHNVF